MAIIKSNGVQNDGKKVETNTKLVDFYNSDSPWIHAKLMKI